ncbi:DeoR/GlpR family transcriptional regulator [Vibrio sagamiensis]|uniref:DeoR/GlpR family transcriptional regulator n=1 Tax=Vibrio sagamiensis NBRC 104589 TaxID=1219064 RepID=A0A511Q9Q0_9VIBR|nr:DeoR/GlpR family transcriptional regulator [Vibrio sagamiensis]PNQ71414.1 DeoR/GlpR family transcriptional regulator [Vibrio agarivorans]GEM74007.1 DeoR/GlpR family transcriptional regulator [Vibrio sagamiensis NBRC 104589]
MKQIPRHQQIIELVIKQGYVSTDELVDKFNVSPQTIRRDLNELADENKIRRYHGGATVPLSSENTSYSMRKELNFNEKDVIAEALVKHIPDGATLFIDIGTTPEAVARALNKKHKQLRVVTNNINVASILLSNPEIKVILAGGEVRNRDGGIVGEATLDFVKQFRLDFGILGISGIDFDGSLLDFDYHEVRVKQAIIDNSRSVFLAVDHSKFGRNAMVKLGNIDQLNMVLTNKQPPAEILSILADASIPLEVVTA